jgi:hypothetical protein
MYYVNPDVLQPAVFIKTATVPADRAEQLPIIILALYRTLIATMGFHGIQLRSVTNGSPIS